jgi:hypothetical protein
MGRSSQFVGIRYGTSEEDWKGHLEENTMDQKTKQAWMDALRSGEYKQATGMLYDQQKDAYCCLGVLCKIVGLEITPDGKNVATGSGSEDDDGYDPITTLVGDKLAPLFNRNDGNVGLVLHKHTFPEIADFIEGYVQPTE